MKNLTIDYKFLAIATVSFSIAFGLMRGTIQNYIHFADPLNEMGVCALALGMGVISAFCIFTKKA
jgi:hypothetical protein